MKVIVWNSGGRCAITSACERRDVVLEPAVVEDGVEITPAVLRETPETEVEALTRVAESDLPPGTVYAIIEADTLPADQGFRDQWVCEVTDGEVAGVVVSADALKPRAKELLAARRWQAEEAGIIWNGHAVATDRGSQAMIAAVKLMSASIPEEGVGWKFKDGFGTVTASDINSIAAAVMTHVQTCFAIEKAKCDLIDAGEDFALNSGWPS